MRRFLILLLLLPHLLHADWDQLFSEDEDPALFHHVNVISGNLNLCMQDGTVLGAKSIPLMRTYSSAGALERTPDDVDLLLKRLRKGFLIQGGWNFFPHANLFVEPTPKKTKELQAYLAEPSGNLIHYVFDQRENKDTIYLKPKINSSQCSGLLSARTNPKNNVLRLNFKTGEAVLFLPDGGMRFYKRPHHFEAKHIKKYKSYFRLMSETLPSKHRLLYSYDEKTHLVHVSATNPSENKTYSWIHLDYFKKKSPFHFQLKSSDGKIFYYKSTTYKERDYMCDVQSNCKAKEAMQYGPGRIETGARVQQMFLDGKVQFTANYYDPPDEHTAKKWAESPKKKKPFHADKVASLTAPIGTNGENIQIAAFIYFPDHTDVRDSDNLLTRYHHNSERLSQIDYFNEKNQIHSQQKFYWEGSNLKRKEMCDPTGRILFSKSFEYDSLGNVREENFLAASGESLRKTYQYLPHFNLPILEVEENGLTFRYTYKDNTNLLTSKLTCGKEKILLREFYFYDQDHLLTTEIVDDGSSPQCNDLTHVSERHTKRYELDSSSGLPKAIIEAYLDHGHERILKKTLLTYTPENRIQTEAVYDAEGIYRYTLYTDYDVAGRVIRKTTPTGNENTYLYDNLGNLLEVKEVGSPKKIYTYDAAARPISCRENDTTTYTSYNAKGKILSQTDPKGNHLKQTYDAFGRCLVTEFPEIKDEDGQLYTPKVRFTYDIQGNLTSTTSPKGETTQTSYTVLRKPLRVIQADGTAIQHFYNKNGTLAKTLYPDQTEIHYTYDLFHRTTSKSIYSSNQLLTTETWIYNTLHLLSYTDPKGLTIYYTYDPAGRKKSETAENRNKSFFYDSLSFLEKVTVGDTSQVTLCDPEGRIVEQWENEHENRTRFFYNKEGQKEKAIRITSQGEAIDLFSYDDEGRLSSHTDPDGNVSQFIYTLIPNERALQKTIIDPLQNSAIETQDALGHIISFEKKNPQGNTVSKEQLFYDKSGNKTKRISTVYLEERPIKEITVHWEYDALGRVIKEQESGKKPRYYSYDTRGRLNTHTLPNGITLTYSYDGIDRLCELSSSDDTLHYQYFYEQGPLPTQILDLVHNTTCTRSYNSFAELTSETTSSNLTLNWDYDSQGRCTYFTLPDRSTITYTYTKAHLTCVQRGPYAHHYDKFDPNGHVEEERLILNLGTLATTHDLFERPTSQTSPYLTHSISYGKSGLITDLRNSLFGDKQCSYDALNQLTQEGNEEHQFDSLGNPTSCEVNDCNQILANSDSRFTYDDNGNLIQRISSNEVITYRYDALDRLIEIAYPSKKICYSYDPFSRLTSKKIYQDNQYEKILYLYDQDKEIGTLNERGEILQLKILGLGIKGDIGAAIAIEIGSSIFAPLHDFNGNIIALIDSNGQISETYNITAFGKETPSSTPLNPWRFCSKRSEENLIFFGKRFYDPSLGRWLTPDPTGFADCSNLYVYVCNSPLNRLDLFGLISEEQFPWLDKNPYPHPLNIEVPIYLIKSRSDNKWLIPCKITMGKGVECDGLIGCSWYKLRFTPKEWLEGKVNIVDHFIELMPQSGDILGLLSGKNGINTSFKEFANMCGSFVEKIPEDPLFIGLYTRSLGLIKDLYEVHKEQKGIITSEIQKTSQIMGALVQIIHKINPDMRWLHIAHSRAGLITKRGIEIATPEQQKLFQSHLCYFGFGSADPMPLNYVSSAFDAYSESDHFTKRFATKYKNDPNYNIHFLPCISQWKERSMFIADHGVMGRTGQTAVSNHFIDYRKKYGFYDSKTR